MLHDARDAGATLAAKMAAAKRGAGSAMARGRWSQMSTAYDNFRPLAVEERASAAVAAVASMGVASPVTPRRPVSAADAGMLKSSVRSPLVGKLFKKTKKRNLLQRLRDHLRRKLGLLRRGTASQ
jgi:hypothetical protein